MIQKRFVSLLLCAALALCLLAGCEAITLPLDVAQQMLGTPAVESAIEKFEQDWNNAFGTLNL